MRQRSVAASLLAASWSLVAGVVGAAPAGAGAHTVEPAIALPRASRFSEVRWTNDAHAPIRIGALGGVGFPRPLSGEVMIILYDAIALGAEYGKMPATTVGAMQVGYGAYALDLRLFPLRSSFFIGARVLRQHLESSASFAVDGAGTYGGSLSMDTWYVNPRIGFLWTWKSGFCAGMDAGVQIPVSHTSTTTLSSALPPGKQIPTGLTVVTDTLGARILPTVTLMHLGLIF